MAHSRNSHVKIKAARRGVQALKLRESADLRIVPLEGAVAELEAIVHRGLAEARA